jgi:hypothetical protein
MLDICTPNWSLFYLALPLRMDQAAKPDLEIACVNAADIIQNIKFVDNLKNLLPFQFLIIWKMSGPGTIFTTHYFLLNSRMDTISLSVCSRQPTQGNLGKAPSLMHIHQGNLGKAPSLMHIHQGNLGKAPSRMHIHQGNLGKTPSLMHRH